jgi:hypothetical protein
LSGILRYSFTIPYIFDGLFTVPRLMKKNSSSFYKLVGEKCRGDEVVIESRNAMTKSKTSLGISKGSEDF